MPNHLSTSKIKKNNISQARQTWTLSPKPEMMEDGVYGYTVNVDPALTQSLNTEDILSLQLPGFETEVTAKIANTFNEMVGVHVWQGNIEYDHPVLVDGNAYDGHVDDNIVIAKGKLDTHITIATRKGTYTIVYDNKTGKGSLIDEAEYIAQGAAINDGIVLPHIPETFPEESE